MAVSLGNRHQTQTSKSILKAQRPSSFNLLSTKWSSKKQNSFIEIGSTKLIHTPSNRNHLTRGLSVSRSTDNLQQNILMPLAKQKKSNGSALCKQYSIERKSSNQAGAATQTKNYSLKLSKNLSYCDAVFKDANDKRNELLQKQNSAYSSTTDLINLTNYSKISDVRKYLDDKTIKNSTIEKDVCKILKIEHSSSSYHCQSKADVTSDKINCITTDDTFDKINSTTIKNTPNKINLNIVLPQAIKGTTENESGLSDVEGSFDVAETKDKQNIQTEQLKTKAESERRSTTVSNSLNLTTTTAASYTASATNKRAQFHISRGLATTTIQTITSANAPTANTAALNSNAINVSPSLIVQRRPPLVRAMSAPVRSADESSKSLLGGNKRKPRRRKFNARNVNCDKNPDESLAYTAEKEFLLDADINSNKKVLSRARTVVASDLITLVSLVSSEGSDSEKEDNLTSTSATNSVTTPQRRAPLLRKTGKSVSFQEKFLPNFQLASKEYSHMLRRASILPLAARIRSNRPPTAPPVSIFLTVSNKENAMADAENKKPNLIDSHDSQDEKENKRTTLVTQDYEYPIYVRSLKEKECWKLYHKMCANGVSVTYETIARGMLTPTEFRQLQKQREQEEDKARKVDEANLVEEIKKPSSAIERLSESLLKKNIN